MVRIVMLLDRSGSMQSIKDDVEGGFAAFIEQQARARGACEVTLARFDTEYERVYPGIPVEEVPRLELEPRGGTALLDGMARLILDTDADLAALPKAARPGAVSVVVMTDGMENSSVEWSHATVKALVDQQRRRHDWQFVYMGADQDAVGVGTGMGFDAGHSVAFGRGRSREAMGAVSENIAGFRGAAPGSAVAVLALAPFSPEQRANAADCGGTARHGRDRRWSCCARVPAGVRLPDGRSAGVRLRCVLQAGFPAGQAA